MEGPRGHSTLVVIILYCILYCQVKSSQVKSSQVKSSQVKSSQVKSSQVKSRLGCAVLSSVLCCAVL